MNSGMKLYSYLCILLLLMVGQLRAQNDFNVFSGAGRGGVNTTFATDYQTLGVNPANLGFEDPNEHMFSLGIAEMGGAVHSTALDKREVRKEVLAFPDRKFTDKEKREAARKFVDKGLTFGVNAMPVGFGGHFKKIGGFAANVRLRTNGSMHLNEFASNLLFLGYNYDNYFDTTQIIQGDTLGIVRDNPKTFSEVFGGTHIKFASFLEFSVGYGRHIIKSEDFALYVGGGIKYLKGYGMLEVQHQGDSLVGFSAITPRVPIKYGKQVKNSPSYVRDSSLSSVGSGLGFELGATVVINKSIKLAASLVDIGGVTWTGNVFKVKDNVIDSLNYKGADNYNMYQHMRDISGDEVFNWQGIEKRRQPLPTRLRLGASIELIEKKLEIGADAVIPFNDSPANLNRSFLAVGGDYYIGRLFRLSSGVSFGGNYGFNVPLGASFFLNQSHSYEIGVSTQDIMVLFGKNNPTYSLSAGFLRFKF